MIDLEHLMQSLGEDAPCGEDLEYDSAFTELMLANQPTEERVIGDSVIAAEDPDFDIVVELATGLLGRTRDIRVAVVLAHAALRTGGLPAFEKVLAYMRGSLVEFWDCVHPQLDSDDDNDPTMRVNAVLGLTDGESLLRALRLAPLTDSRGLGRFCLRDMLVAAGEISASEEDETTPDQQLIFAAFQDSSTEHLDAVRDAVSASIEHVTEMSAVFDERVGAAGPDLDPLAKVLRDIQSRLPEAEDANSDEAAEDLGDDQDAPQQVLEARHPGAPGSIESPADVQAAIDGILDYYARREPSSPLPLLLQRAQRLVSADFVTIMKDMAPQGMDNVALIGGLQQEEDAHHYE